MGLNRREQILSVAGVILLGGAWILTSEPPAPVPGANSGLTVTKTSAVNPDQASEVLNQLHKDPTLSRADPFALSIPKPEAPVALEVVPVATTFSLQGIFSDAKGRAAVINGAVARENEEISPGVIVKSILDDSVMIDQNGQPMKIGF